MGQLRFIIFQELRRKLDRVIPHLLRLRCRHGMSQRKCRNDTVEDRLHGQAPNLDGNAIRGR